MNGSGMASAKEKRPAAKASPARGRQRRQSPGGGGHSQRRGHVVTVAHNGREALAAVELQEFDVVLMDVQMPEMGGLEATRLIREREDKRAVAVCRLSPSPRMP